MSFVYLIRLHYPCNDHYYPNPLCGADSSLHGYKFRKKNQMNHLKAYLLQ